MKDGIQRTQRWLKGLTLAFLLGAPLASADLITFDDLDPSEGSVSEQGYAGFNWDSRWSLGNSDMSGFGDAAHSGSQFLYNQGFESHLEIARDNPFDFMGAYFASTSIYNNMSFWITLVAYDGQGNKVGELIDAQINPDFENRPLWIAADFTNVSRLVVDAAGGIFAMDSLQFRDSVVSVNEAGGFVLLLIGLGGLWAARRRVH